MARRERRDGPPEREPEAQDLNLAENERESVLALKTILSKIAGLVKPLGLTPEESTRLVESMYESVLEMDVKLAGESDDRRRSLVLSHVQGATIRREDDKLVVDYPSKE